MLNTVRAFAIRWLLEPVANTVKMMIRKTDGNGNFVPGARLELDFNSDTNAGNVTVTGAADVIVYINETTSALDMQTGTEPIIIDGLLPGRYFLYEWKTPNGYNRADSMGFVINSDGSITPNSTSSETCIVTGNRFDVINEKIRGIRYVVCYIDNPTDLKIEYDIENFAESAGHMSVYSSDQSELITIDYQQWHTDSHQIQHTKYTGCMAVKIYDGDDYIGYYMLINAQKKHVYSGSAILTTTPYFGTDNVGYNGNMPFPPGVTYSYENTRNFWTSDNDNAKKYNLLWPDFPSEKPPTLPALGDYDRYENTAVPYARSSYEHYYTPMTQRGPYTRNMYIMRWNCTFDPKPDIGATGKVGDYYADEIDRQSETVNTITSVSRYDTEHIAVKHDYHITTTTKYVNFRKIATVGDPTTSYDWEDREEIVTKESSNWSSVILPLDVSAYTDYSEYDPENLNNNGYVYYGDGMTAEKLAKYAAYFAAGSTTARQIVVEYEN